MKRGQISIEYLVLVAFAMILILPSVYLYSERQKSYQGEMVSVQVSQIGNSIIDDVKSIYSLGKGSNIIVDTNFPAGVNNMSIMAGRELVFNVQTTLGRTDLVFTCYFCNTVNPTLNGTFSKNDTMQGRKSFRIMSCGSFVLIERVTRNSTGGFNPVNGPSPTCN
jgi:hypothetical protein